MAVFSRFIGVKPPMSVAQSNAAPGGPVDDES